MWRVTAIELVSPLPADECAVRLREATDRAGLLSWSGNKPVVGRVSGRFVRLHKRILYRNPFQTYLAGSLESDGTGTVFRGNAGMDLNVTAFMVVWFALAVLIGGIIFVATIMELAVGKGELVGLIAGPLMVTLGAGGVWFGRYWARGEEQFLVAFVMRVILAHSGRDTE
jgi:hypothetical protein